MGSVTGCVGRVYGGTKASEYCPFSQVKYMLVKWYQYLLSTHSVPTGIYCVYKNIEEDAVLCSMPVGNDTVCA